MMRDNTIERCPVCGASTETAEGYICQVCAFPYAGVVRFAGARSRDAFQKLVQEKKGEILGRMQKNCAQHRLFDVQGGMLLCRLPSGLRLVSGSGVQELKDIAAFSAPLEPARNRLYLRKNGTVSAEGPNDMGQNETRGMKGIKDILASYNCNYAITKTGTVSFSGQPAAWSVADWKDVEQLVSGRDHVAGRTAGGRVLLAGNILPQGMADEVQTWRDIKTIAAADNALLGLRKDGTVVFAGDAGDPRREAARWKGVVAIAVESVYAVGLTEDGRVLLAGKQIHEQLDQGRSGAAQWRDVVAIAASRSGIAAVSVDGQLLLAGILRDAERLKANWQLLQSEFVTAALKAD